LADAASEAIASKLISAIEAAFQRLLIYPLFAPSREAIAPGMRVMFEGSYAIYYLASATELVIVRVLHSARDIATICDEGGL